MGIGPWQEREDWPEEVSWIKHEKELKILGFMICPTYQQTVKRTWETVVSGFERTLFAWSTRSLDTLSQRVEVAKTFVLSKLFNHILSSVIPVKNLPVI